MQMREAILMAIQRSIWQHLCCFHSGSPTKYRASSPLTQSKTIQIKPISERGSWYPVPVMCCSILHGIFHSQVCRSQTPVNRATITISQHCDYSHSQYRDHQVT